MAIRKELVEESLDACDADDASTQIADAITAWRREKPRHCKCRPFMVSRQCQLHKICESCEGYGILFKEDCKSCGNCNGSGSI